MKKLTDRLVSWLDTAREAPRLKAAGFHFCHDTSQWMLDETAFPSREAAMRRLREMEITQAVRRCVA